MPFICVSTYVSAHMCLRVCVCVWLPHTHCLFFLLFFEVDRNELIEYSQRSKAQCETPAWSALHWHESYMLLWRGMYEGEEERKGRLRVFLSLSFSPRFPLDATLQFCTFKNPADLSRDSFFFLDWSSSPFPKCSFGFKLKLKPQFILSVSWSLAKYTVCFNYWENLWQLPQNNLNWQWSINKVWPDGATARFSFICVFLYSSVILWGCIWF